MVVGQVAGTRDIFPGHHDPAFARAQGQQDIYLNTVFYQAFVDRVATEGAGSGWVIVRRRMRIVASTYPGDVLVGTGVVSRVDRGSSGAARAVDIDILLRARDEVVVVAQVELHSTRGQGVH